MSSPYFIKYAGESHRVEESEKHYHFPYPLDDFQEEGIYRIHNDENILITAHTGSGKTTFALYAIAQALAKNQRVVYTSPIKSLSNQKYAEFKKLFGEDQIGILTGDIKMNPDASCLIMTTEILRNMLYKTDEKTREFVASIGIVIFDEIHYINDKDRGKVWEETLILLPRNIILVMLSATISGAEEFATWLGNIKERRTVLIPTTHRVVPLNHYVFDYERARLEKEEKLRKRRERKEREKKGLPPLEEEREDENEFTNPLPMRMVMNEMNEIINVAEIRRNYRVIEMRDILDVVIFTLHERKMTPALFFVFSRNQCEKLSKMVNIHLIDHEVRSQILETFHKHMLPYEALYRDLRQYQDLYQLIQKGIAYHHSGMIPILKEIVEILFGMGLIKVLFATETFAVGVNMPTKTVLFPSFQKYDNQGLRYLNHAEYTQMAGRAGRRGLDKVGNVIILPSAALPEDAEWNDILNGKSPKVESRFVPTYQFVLKQIYQEISLSSASESDSEDEIENKYTKFLEDSYYMNCHQRRSVDVIADLLRMKERMCSIEVAISEREIAEYERLKRKLSGEGMGAYFVMKEKDKKKIQGELQALKKRTGTGASTDFDTALRKYHERKGLEAEIERRRGEIDGESTYLYVNIREMREWLRELGYLEKGDCEEGKMGWKLSQKGMIGMNIQECNELLFTYMLEKYMGEELSYEEWVGLFGLFIEEKDLNQEEVIVSDLKITERMKEIIRDLEEAATEFANEEMRRRIHIGTKYQLHYDFVEVLYRWARGDRYADIMDGKRIFDGNFVKGVLRAENIVEDVMTICQSIENYPLLQLFENHPIPLVRDIAHINSLYLTI